MKKEIPAVVYPGVVYSHYETKKIIGEQFIGEYGVCYVISGILKVTDAGQNRTFSAGDVLFYRKNFLAKFIKMPAEDIDFKSITIILNREALLEFGGQYGYRNNAPYKAKEAVIKLAYNELLANYFKTLTPYFDAELPENLILLKRQEVLLLLLQVNPDLKNMLFDFSQPGKINLEAFMQQNFRFNVDLKRLAFLTGRSLAAFKRDFEKIFHISPNRWLQQRRLQEAHYLIQEEKKRPSAIYHEIGFESLSHFSYSFKKQYGVSPSDILNTNP